MERFLEDHLDLGDRIFVRLLNPIWRNQIGGRHGPYERKQTEAIYWIDQLVKYLRDLEACISSVMLRLELWRALPLNTYLHFSADECIRRLAHQEAALKRIQTGPATPTASDRRDELRTQLSVAVERSGIEHCALQSGLHPDTIFDFLENRVSRPQKKTLETLEKFLASLQRPPAKTGRHISRGFRTLQP